MTKITKHCQLAIYACAYACLIGVFSHAVLLQRQKKGHDLYACEQQFSLGDHVFVRNFANGPVWLSGRVLEITGPCSCVVTLQDGRLVRRHQDHIRRRSSSPGDDAVEQPRMEMADPLPARQESQVTEEPNEATESEDVLQEESAETQSPPPQPVVPERRYPLRERQSPERYGICNQKGGRSVEDYKLLRGKECSVCVVRMCKLLI